LTGHRLDVERSDRATRRHGPRVRRESAAKNPRQGASLYSGRVLEATSRAATVGTALFTDKYELTMLEASLADGSGDRPCVFEVFARRLPAGRRYGIVAGTGRLLE